MGKTKYKGLRIDYKPNQKVKVMLGRDWFDAEVVKSNKKTVVVRTLFSKTKYRQVQVKEILPEHGGIAEDAALGHPKTVLEPYTVSGTKVVKLPRIRVKPIEAAPRLESSQAERPDSGQSLDTSAGGSTPQVEQPPLVSEPEYEGPGLGKDEAPLVDYESGSISEVPMAAEQAEAMLENAIDAKPESAADVLAELEKMMH